MAPVTLRFRKTAKEKTAKERLAEIDKEKAKESGSIKAVAAFQKKRARVMKEYAKGVDKMSFKEAFAAKRKAGNKTFTWRGKKYTTELAKPTTKTSTFNKKVTAINKKRAAERKAKAEARRKTMQSMAKRLKSRKAQRNK
tara:strand:- start:640 stop:1059 length:420 start_codon:yes stop_codon:yes gene_type:complete